MDYTEAAGLVVGSVAGVEFLRFLVVGFLKKASKDDYVSYDECGVCRSATTESHTKIMTQLGELRGITLVVAMKVGIPNDELTKLVK